MEMKHLALFIFITLILIHLSLVLLINTTWASDFVVLTNLVSASLYLPSLLFEILGIPVMDHGQGWFSNFTSLGWLLIILFWLIIYWGASHILTRIRMRLL
jgi:hypothetical protein